MGVGRLGNAFASLTKQNFCGNGGDVGRVPSVVGGIQFGKRSLSLNFRFPDVVTCRGGSGGSSETQYEVLFSQSIWPAC